MATGDKQQAQGQQGKQQTSMHQDLHAQRLPQSRILHVEGASEWDLAPSTGRLTGASCTYPGSKPLHEVRVGDPGNGTTGAWRPAIQNQGVVLDVVEKRCKVAPPGLLGVVQLQTELPGRAALEDLVRRGHGPVWIRGWEIRQLQAPFPVAGRTGQADIRAEPRDL